MSNEDIRMALAEWSREELVESWIGLNTLLEISAVRREKAEARCTQLEEALRKIRVHAASRWILETVDAALASLREPSEAQEKEE